VSGQIHAPAALPCEKSSRYSLVMKLVKHQRESGHCGKEEKSQPLLEMEPRSSST